jgi:spoIIIJ-associated protein
MSDDTDVTTRRGDLENGPGEMAGHEDVADDAADDAADDVADDAVNDAVEGEVTTVVAPLDGLDSDRVDLERPAVEGAEAETSDTDAPPGANETARGGSRVPLLEKEGEVAADFLERLLDIADLDGDIEVDIDGDRASIAIVDSEDGRVPRRLVGADGKVLDALQELTRLAVQAETGERSRLMLDVAGHRAQRRAVVVEIARTAIAEVTTTGATKALDDMSAFERKIVHDEVAAAGLTSESEGVEPHRHIVVFPA